MTEEPERRGRGRPPIQGQPFEKMRANVLPPQAERLAVIAKGRGVSLSELVREILAEWLDRHPGGG